MRSYVEWINAQRTFYQSIAEKSEGGKKAHLRTRLVFDLRGPSVSVYKCVSFQSII